MFELFGLCLYFGFCFWWDFILWVLLWGFMCGTVAELVFGFNVMKSEMRSMNLVVLYWQCICVGEVFDVWSVWGLDEVGTDCGLNPLRTGFVFSMLLFNLSHKSRTRKMNTGKVQMFLERKSYSKFCAYSPCFYFSSQDSLQQRFFISKLEILPLVP